MTTTKGSFNGSLASLKASDLGAIVLKQIITQTQTFPDEVILGQALTAGQGLIYKAMKSRTKIGLLLIKVFHYN